MMNRLIPKRGWQKSANESSAVRGGSQKLRNCSFRRLLLAAAALVGLGQSTNAQSTTFGYTGSVQTYSVTSTGTLAIDMAGARGGDIYENVAGSLNYGGYGGRVVCTLAVTAGQVLNIYVGGAGETATSLPPSNFVSGGFNGGGVGRRYNGVNVGGGGGGATDIRIGGVAFSDRVIVAGGGGGAGIYGTGDNYNNGGGGGGLTGGHGYWNGSNTASQAGAGGTQATGGSGGAVGFQLPGEAGALGSGGNAGSNNLGGGGGGGYYGGGGGNFSGGGGGSSFTNSSLVTGATHTQGFQNGDGYAVITSICTPPTVVGSGGGAFCQGTAATLTASGATTYSWSPSIGLSATTGASVSATPTTTTTYTVTGANGSCTNTATVTVNVRPLPSATFTVSPSAVCVGTSQSFVTSVGSCSGSALGFSGGTHRASRTGAVSTVTDNFTMEAWVKFNGATGAYQVIMHNGNTGGDGYGLIVPPSSTSLVLLRGGLANTATGITLPTSGWHHVAIVRDAGNWASYLDGTKYAFTDGAVATPTTGFYVGNSTGLSQQFNGSIDEVTFWNVARTTSQIQSDMNPCNITTNTNLRGYWKFNEASGSSTADGSGNGNTLTVSGASWITSGADVPTYSWSFGDGSTSTLAAPSKTYTAAGTFTPTLTLTNTLGCSASATSTATVNAYPVVNTGSMPTICAGGSATLTATGATTYTWSPATGLSATTGSSVVASPSSTMTWFVTGTSNGCSTLVTASVSVNSTPAASTGQSFTCAGGSITLSNVTGGGTWSSSNTAVATVGSSTGVVTGVSSGVVNITYALGTGCFTTKSVTVNPAMASITGSPYVCLNTTSDLDHAMPGGTWSVASSYYVTVNSSTGLITGVNSGATTVTYTVNSGCVVTTPVYTSNVILNITGSLSVCEGSTSMLTVPGYAGATWSTPDSATAYINATTGALLGISAGTVPVTVTYGYCYRSAIATVNPVPATISGGSAVCAGSTLSLSCSTGGGAWSSSNTAKATVNSSGVVTGVAPGTSTISYTLGTGCAATKVVSVGAMPASITGTTTVCVGSTTNLACTTLGGTWSSSATSTADVVSGTVTGIASYTTIGGVATGGATISYSMPAGCVQTVNVTVATPPSSIGGALAICSGGSSTLTSSGGGTWSSSLTTVATIGSATGIAIGGTTTGTARITYRTSSTCYTTAVVTVSTPTAIGGPASVCKTYTVTLTHSAGGGTWSSSNAAVATVDATTGVVTGVAAGAVNITYNISTGCYAVKTLQVYNNPSAISGPATICVGASASLTGTSGTGTTWSSSNASVASVGSSTGLVTGVSAGNANITYTITSTGCYSTRAQTINETPSTITGATPICVDANETYVSSPSGGTWSSTVPSVGSINATSGVATGRTGGGTTIKYTLPSGCFTTKAITVSPLPAAIGGTSLVCVGSNVLLTSATSGSTWSSSASGVASITATPATSAVINGVSEGTANISYTNAAGCFRVFTVTVNPTVAAIEGPSVVCAGNTIALTNSTPGGTWSSMSTDKVTIGTSTGVATGGSVTGISIIVYYISAGCKTSTIVTNNAAPGTIAGVTSVCVGSATTFSTTATGGTWSSSGSEASVDAATGVISGVSAGTNTISYIVSEGCYSTRSITVKALPIAFGVGTLAVGSTTAMVGSPSGGSWASSAVGIASVTATGNVTGVSPGIALISYSVGGCTATSELEVIISSPESRPSGAIVAGIGGFIVFPNPTQGSLSVSTGVAGTFAIYTVDGKLASTSELAEGVNAISMPAGMAAGTYLCRFQGVDGSVQSVRLVYEP